MQLRPPVRGNHLVQQRQKAARLTSACTRSVIALLFAWLEAGVHIKALADLLDHSSIAISGDVYGHTSDSTARSAVDGLADQLGLQASDRRCYPRRSQTY
jgi:integrase